MFHIGVATKHPPLPERGEISDVAINFLKQCLTVDPFKRPSASELISHPWMLEVRGELQEVQRGHSNSASGSTSSPTRLSPSASRSNSAGEEGLATVAREARRIEEEEIANIVTSPPVDPVPSPTGEPPTPLSF
jgi:mitogen-activated protein kinase kinase kinase